MMQTAVLFPVHAGKTLQIITLIWTLLKQGPQVHTAPGFLTVHMALM